MISQYLKNIWNNIRQGQNLDVYITFLISLVVAVLGIFQGVNTPIIMSAILAVLSLVTIWLLSTRHSEQELKDMLTEILTDQRTTNKEIKLSLIESLNRKNRPRLSEVLIEYGDGIQTLVQRFQQADEVWILSRTCGRIWGDYEEELQRIACRTGLRLLFLNPTSGALKMVATTAVWDKPDELNRLKNNLEGFVSRLRYIQSEMGMQKLDVHLLDYLPAWTLILINPTRSDAIAYVEMATYRAHPRKRPTFIVECSQDNPLFSLFRDEYEQMWKNAQPAWNQTLCGLR